MWLHEHGLPGCWLTDKEARMRKAAAYFALRRIVDANDGEDSLDAQGKMAKAAKAIEEARSDAAKKGRKATGVKAWWPEETGSPKDQVVPRQANK